MIQAYDMSRQLLVDFRSWMLYSPIHWITVDGRRATTEQLIELLKNQTT